MFGRNNQEFIEVCGYRINTNDISYYIGMRGVETDGGVETDSNHFKLVICLKNNPTKLEIDFEEKNEELISVLNYLDNILLNNGIPYRMPNRPGSYSRINNEELEREINRGLNDIWNFSNEHFNPNRRGFKRFDEGDLDNNYTPYSRSTGPLYSKETPFGKEIKK